MYCFDMSIYVLLIYRISKAEKQEIKGKRWDRGYKKFLILFITYDDQMM